jgi:hypothetical protein
MVNKAFISPKFMQKQINKQNPYLLLALLQFGSVPELDMHVSKHFLPGQFIHSGYIDRCLSFCPFSDLSNS